ncbi:hypothetical protein OIE66_19930 [Nonomuraea sp. NBC_01738]|uniref:hypothetical protein n=1 Tax=Nonomuraea sp. NBC_01738 TaxID=2976003 RepID=UPI002E10F381|nr:hypothetical protein OIE66_19930 [Nonomuraea sp. NBC_01738]
MSREAEVRYHADLEISKSYPELMEKARLAEATARELRAADAPELELRAAGLAFDRALTEALRGAEAGQRAVFGVNAYDDRIARRKARATPSGSEWTAEVDRLRTMREENRMWGIPRLPRPVPAAR